MEDMLTGKHPKYRFPCLIWRIILRRYEVCETDEAPCIVTLENDVAWNCAIVFVTYNPRSDVWVPFGRDVSNER